MKVLLAVTAIICSIWPDIALAASYSRACTFINGVKECKTVHNPSDGVAIASASTNNFNKNEPSSTIFVSGGTTTEHHLDETNSQADELDNEHKSFEVFDVSTDTSSTKERPLDKDNSDTNGLETETDYAIANPQSNGANVGSSTESNDVNAHFPPMTGRPNEQENSVDNPNIHYPSNEVYVPSSITGNNIPFFPQTIGQPNVQGNSENNPNAHFPANGVFVESSATRNGIAPFFPQMPGQIPWPFNNPLNNFMPPYAFGHQFPSQGSANGNDVNVVYSETDSRQDYPLHSNPTVNAVPHQNFQGIFTGYIPPAHPWTFPALQPQQPEETARPALFPYSPPFHHISNAEPAAIGMQSNPGGYNPFIPSSPIHGGLGHKPAGNVGTSGNIGLTWTAVSPTLWLFRMPYRGLYLL